MIYISEEVRKIAMSSLREEIQNCKASLDQLEIERRNLIQHFQIQEDNYTAMFKSYHENVERLLKQKDDIIAELQKEKNKLEAFVLGETKEVTITKKPT